MRTYAKTLVVAATLVLALVGAAQAMPITVANYSFEAPPIDSGTSAVTPLLPGWTWAGSGNCGLQHNAIGYLDPVATDGNQVAYVNGGGAVYQTLNDTTMSEGDVLTLKVDVVWSHTNGIPGASGILALYADAPVANPSATWSITNSLAQDTTWLPNLPADAWETFTLTYTATAADAGKKIGIWMGSSCWQYMADNVRLEVGLPGDTDNNGVVDVNDLNNVFNNLGTAGPVGETNGDGIIDVLDLNNVFNNLGTVAPTGGAVPEPATLSLLALGGLAAVRRRRK